MQDFPSVETQLSDTQLSSLFPLDIPDLSLDRISHYSDLSKEEPDMDDLNDLDQLLTDSLAIAKKSQNKRIYKELKKAVDEKVLCDFQLERWELLENIEVWMRTRCKCGTEGEPTFLRNMQKLKKVGSSLLHWKKVEELEAGEEIRYALITTDVCGCQSCRGNGQKFEEFKQVIE